MGKKSTALGRGLNTIIQDHKVMDAATEKKMILQEIPLEKIDPNPFQPRQTFADDEVRELAETIREHGMLQPINLRKHKGRYQIISGERRFRACQSLNMDNIQAKVADKLSNKQMMELALIENIQRVGLSPIEEAMSFDKLIQSFGYSHEKLAQRVGKSRSALTNTLRLIKLPEQVKNWIHEGRLSASAARALLSPDVMDAEKMARQIIEKGLNVRQVENMGRKTRKRETSTKTRDPNIVQLEKDLSYALARKVEFRGDGRTGSLLIHYDSGNDLRDLMDILQNAVTS